MMNLAQIYCLIIRYRVPPKVNSVKNSEVKNYTTTCKAWDLVIR